uniref:Uncharacterized protein n=1 Tax=Leptobrachium leishanense TaxID=445787 RepID=A0A8C5LT08_9ANUR
MSAPDPAVFLAQRLAGNEKKIRDRAVRKLRRYLRARSAAETGGFSEEELGKIWKGLFYCLWMQDKPLLQEELANTTSHLIHALKTGPAQQLFIKTFWQTLSREWNGIDRLRLDKFYTLARLVLRRSVELLRNAEWEESHVEEFLAMLTQEVLLGGARGVQFHLIDIYLDELAQVGAAELPAALNLRLIEPFCRMAAKIKDPLLLQAVLSGIFQAILDQAPFAIEDLMREMKETLADSDSGKSGVPRDRSLLCRRPVPFVPAAGPFCAGGRSLLCRRPVPFVPAAGPFCAGGRSLLCRRPVPFVRRPVPFVPAAGPFCAGGRSLLCRRPVPFVPAAGPFCAGGRSLLCRRPVPFVPGISSSYCHNRRCIFQILQRRCCTTRRTSDQCYRFRDLIEGVFPQDDFPEEVSTDEDDDEFSSWRFRKRQKRAQAREAQLSGNASEDPGDEKQKRRKRKIEDSELSDPSAPPDSITPVMKKCKSVVGVRSAAEVSHPAVNGVIEPPTNTHPDHPGNSARGPDFRSLPKSVQKIKGKRCRRAGLLSVGLSVLSSGASLLARRRRVLQHRGRSLQRMLFTASEQKAAAGVSETLIKAADTPKAAVKATDTPKAAVKAADTPKAAVKAADTPKAAVKAADTPKAAVKAADTPKATVKADTPKAAVKAADTPKAAVKAADTPKAAVKAADTPKAAVKAADTPKAAVRRRTPQKLR